MKLFIKLFIIELFLLTAADISKGQAGATLNFDGINDYVSIPHNSLLKPSTAITIEAWIKPANIHSNTYYEIYRKDDGTSRHMFAFQDNGTNLSFGLEVAGVYSELDVPIAASNYENQWVHVAATFDGSSKKIYRNGILIGTQPVAGSIGTAGTAPALIGSYTGTSEFFNGSIDELKIWSKALTQSEIQSNMNCEISAQTGLIAYYKFNEGAAGGSNTGITTLYDWSGNNLNGTLNNFALAGSTSNWATPGGVVSGNNCTPGTQTLAGSYGVNGYFFHPTAPRSISQTKSLIQVGPNSYQAEVADVGGGGNSFQFTIDANNNLVNWIAVGVTPAVPASNFMTLDNPGNFTYSPTPGPGTFPYLQSIYNNTYNPATHTFSMHYGYLAGSTNQNGYNRQIYEKWVLPTPPKITSVTPMSGTYSTQVTITGRNFSTVQAAYGITFGNVNADSAVIVSDSVIKAWVGGGASGYVRVSNPDGMDTLAGFTYTPVPPIGNPQWLYVGTPGFSANRAYNVNATVDRNNIPYVIFVDSVSRKAAVMKYVSNTWINVGLSPSDGKCSNTKIVMDTTNNPVVAFADSTNSGAITVKRYDGNNWINMSVPSASGKSSMAIDGINRLYLLYIDTAINVVRYNGTGWDAQINIGRSSFGDAEITTDKKNNIPYIAFDDYNVNGQATVKKYNGTAWVNVGSPGFSNTLYGAFYPRVKIDTSGTPLVAFQDDNGFERVSVYKFSGTAWSPIGNRFSKSHSYAISLAIDNNSNPYVAFQDNSYNKQGTVLTLDPYTAKWDTLGRRGFLPSPTLEANSFLLDNINTPFIAFSDNSQGGKVSVMKLNIYCYNNINLWTGAVGNIWGDGGNWGCGVVPDATSTCFISGEDVQLGSNTTSGSIILINGATIQLNKYNLNIGTHDLFGVNRTNFIITNDSGSLVRTVGNAPLLFPIGNSANSYTPVTITNTGTADTFSVRVGNQVLTTGRISGTPIDTGNVNRTWFISEAAQGGSNVNLTFQWNLVDEQPSFNRTNSYISHYQVCPPPIGCAGAFYDAVSRTAASGSGPFILTRNNVTNFNSPSFIVTSTPVVYTFVGTGGDWNNSANWMYARVPPNIIPGGTEVIINPSSSPVIFNGDLIIQPGGKLTVMAQKSLIVTGNLIQQ